MNREIDISEINFDASGLVPAIVQDAASGQVLMMAWMNRETLGETLDTSSLVFFSRSRQQRWKKGETSGNSMQLEAAYMDCDSDTLLFKVLAAGPACHNGTTSCFEVGNA